MKKLISVFAIAALALMALACEKEKVKEPDPVVLTVTTNEITDILDTSAKGGGSVSSTTKNAEVTARGLCWSTSQNPTVDDAKTSDGTGLGEFSSTLTNLVGGTTYYVRAYAVCKDGTSYGNQVNFTAGIIPADVVTSPVEEIGQKTAVAVGRIVKEGTLPIDAVGFCWNTAPTPTLEDSYTEEDLGADGSFTAELTYLSFNTTYYVRAFARSGESIYYGNEVSFTTLAETIISIPDANFKNYLLAIADNNKDGELQEGEAELVTEINLSGRSDIRSVEGIKACKNLIRAFIGTTEPALVDAGQYNTLESVDVSGLAYLEEIWLSHTGITSVNVTGCTALHTMHALFNNLTTLDVTTAPALRELHLNENFNLGPIDFSQNPALTNLGLIHTAVRELNLSNHTELLNVWGEGSGIQSLNLQGCSKLNAAFVNYNQLQTINVKGCAALKELHAVGNQIATLDLSDNVALEHMHLNENPVTALNLSKQPNLVNLGVINTQLTSLDLSGKTIFNGLWAEGSKLQTLNLSGSGAREVYVNNNQLTTLNVKGCTALIQLHAVNNRLTSIDLSDLVSVEQMHLNDNQLTSVDLSHLNRIINLGLINNQLTSVNLSGRNTLVGFWGATNPMTSLNVSGCTALDYLEVPNNPSLAGITGLNDCPNLTQLKCENTGISSLTLTNHPKLWLLWSHTCPNLVSVNLTCPALTDMFMSVEDNLEVLDISRCAFVMNYVHAHVSPKLTTIIMKTGQTVTGDFIYDPGVTINRVD